jgi:hypothetical protein
LPNDTSSKDYQALSKENERLKIEIENLQNQNKIQSEVDVRSRYHQSYAHDMCADTKEEVKEESAGGTGSSGSHSEQAFSANLPPEQKIKDLKDKL